MNYTKIKTLIIFSFLITASLSEFSSRQNKLSKKNYSCKNQYIKTNLAQKHISHFSKHHSQFFKDFIFIYNNKENDDIFCSDKINITLPKINNRICYHLTSGLSPPIVS